MATIRFIIEDTYLTCTLQSIIANVMFGKFQTDNLKARFGEYRTMSGCNYLVSVNEVRQNEKKLKVKSILKLYTHSKGEIKNKSFLYIHTCVIFIKCIQTLKKNLFRV